MSGCILIDGKVLRCRGVSKYGWWYIMMSSLYFPKWILILMVLLSHVIQIRKHSCTRCNIQNILTSTPDLNLEQAHMFWWLAVPVVAKGHSGTLLRDRRRNTCLPSIPSASTYAAVLTDWWTIIMIVACTLLCD